LLNTCLYQPCEPQGQQAKIHAKPD
jgi:hypothetical protein